MNPAAVANEISTRLATLSGLVAAYVGPPASVSTPCSVIDFPEGIDYHGTYSRGMSRIDDWPILVLAGRVDSEEAFQRIGRYAATSGDASVVEALESKDTDLYDPYESCHEVIVKNCRFEIITWQTQDFRGAIFTVDVVGSGS